MVTNGCIIIIDISELPGLNINSWFKNNIFTTENLKLSFSSFMRPNSDL